MAQITDPQGPSVTERRRHHRTRCRLNVRPADGGAARTTDISEGGAFLQRLDDGDLQVGQTLDLELCLPDGPLNCAAEVLEVRSEGFYLGGAVRFTALDPAAAARIRQMGRRPRPGARPLARIALLRAAEVC